MLIYSRNDVIGDRIIFLDRDGTINLDTGYISDPKSIQLLDGTIEGLSQLQHHGFMLAIVTNQSGVGRGLFSLDTARKVNQAVIDLLSRQGIEIAAAAACFHAPHEECDCRKPAPALAIEIAAALRAPLRNSVVIGDKPSDIGLAIAIGARSILIGSEESSDFGQTATARNLVSATRLILGWDATARSK